MVVDAALGLQKLGHSVDIFTSHHDPSHCFDETRDGTLRVHHIVSPFPRSVKGKFHILLAHARQLHLTRYLLRSDSPQYDVYFVDQLSTCVPFLRLLAGRRVVFYCHFPDKLLANGEFVEGKMHMRGGWLKRVYRLPMDRLEEITTRMSITHHQLECSIYYCINDGRTSGCYTCQLKIHFPCLQVIFSLYRARPICCIPRNKSFSI